MEEEPNRRERIKGRDFEQGGVYEVYDKDNYSLGIYFYPTSYPERMEYVYNTRGIISKTLNRISEPLKLLILYSRIYHGGKGKYIKFDKSKIYGKKHVSIIRSESSFSEEIDLSKLDLSYADLKDSKLIRINLSNVNLSHANLTGSDLTGTNLTRANLSGAKLGKTILKDIESSQIIGSPYTLPKGYYLVDGCGCIIGPDTKIPESLSNKYKQIEIKNGNITKQYYLVGPNVDLTDAVLTRATLSNIDLTGANLTGANLTGAKLNNIDLTGANLTNVDLTDAFFYNTVILTGIKSSLIKGIPEKLPIYYYLFDGIIIGPGTFPNNKNNTFNTIKLKKKYKQIQIRNGNNTKQYLVGPNVDLTGANLTRVNLKDFDLTGADLTRANLTRADLTGADLTRANLTRADLTGADLTGAKLNNVKSGSIQGKPTLPKGYLLTYGGYIIGPKVDLTGSNLTYADLKKVDLTGANLTGANLTSIDLNNADLTGADLTDIKSGFIEGNPTLPDGYVLRNGYIIGPKVDLTGSNLTGVDLTNVVLIGIKSGLIKGNPTLPDGYILINGYIIGQKVNLKRANLRGVNLRGVNLTDSDLTRANLSGANLNDADLTNVVLIGIKSGFIEGNPTLPNEYVLKNGYIIGPKVNLTGENLTGTDLTNVDLTGADLNGANLTNVVLTRANLTSVDFTHVVSLNGVVFIDANLTDADLRGVNLTNVNLTGANLTRANLHGATINDNTLSEEQTSQILGQPMIDGEEMEIFNGKIIITKNLSNGNRVNKNGKILNKSNTTTPYEKSYERLFDFLLKKSNQEIISKKFRIQGQPGVDAGGVTRTVFQNCYEAFRERYFVWDKELVNYFILKNLSHEKFNEFKKACAFMILLAKKAEVKILLPIHNLLLRLLLSDKPHHTFFKNIKSFLDNENSIFVKKNNGTYSQANQYRLNTFLQYPLDYTVLENSELERLGENNENQSAAFPVGAKAVARKSKMNNNNGNNHNARNNGNNPNPNAGNNGNNPNPNAGNNGNNGNNLNGGKRYNNYNKSNQSKLLLGMFLHSQKFETIDHFLQMKAFIEEYWIPNPNIFTNKIDYSYEAFIKRLKFKLPGQNFITFKEFEREEYEMYNTYPLIQLILEYLKHSDKYRMTFTTFTCGSYTYDGIIKIFINNTEIHNLNPPSSTPPFAAHTCFHYIDINIDLREGCECPDVFYSTLIENSNKNNNNPRNNGNNKRTKCKYSLLKLNKRFENREFNSA